MGVREAVAMACRVRLRPVLMTSLATIIGLLPMALKLGAGSEAYAPLARAILGGLSVSVALTVFLVPAAYVLVYDRSPRRAGSIRWLNHAILRIFWLAGRLAAPRPAAMHLTLADAETLAMQNNPQIHSARFTAAAAYQVPKNIAPA